MLLVNAQKCLNCHLQPAGVSFMKHIKAIRDPSTLAILYEDGAACLGNALCYI
jgi:hypothetical protein